MQSDGNSFCGDVVLDSFNMKTDENSNLDKDLAVFEKKMHIQRNLAYFNKELITLGLVLMLCLYAFS